MMQKLLVLLMMISCLTIIAQDDADLSNIEAAISAGDYSLAIEESQKIINSGVGDSALLSMANAYAGLSYENQSDYSNAIKYYKKAVDLRVPRLDIYQKLAQVAKSQEDNDTYEYALIEECCAFSDFCIDVKPKLATHYIKTKQYEKLSATSSELLTWYPDDTKYLYYKAVAMENLDSIEQAEAYYKKVIALDSDNLKANRGLGVMLYEKGAVIFKKEKKVYESIAKPDRIDYHNYIKALDGAKEIYREAEGYLLKANELKPSKNLNSVLYNLYVRLGESSKAEQCK